jgi:hypothetical protein
MLLSLPMRLLHYKLGSGDTALYFVSKITAAL